MIAYEGYFENGDFYRGGKVMYIPERKPLTIIISEDEKPTVKKHKTLEKRLEEFYNKNIDDIVKEHANDYQPEEINWGKAVGNEIW
jgi:hypothetical protein